MIIPEDVKGDAICINMLQFHNGLEEGNWLGGTIQIVVRVAKYGQYSLGISFILHI